MTAAPTPRPPAQKRCRVCTHPFRDQIEKEYTLRLRTREKIQEKYDVSEAGLRRHFINGHLPEEVELEIIAAGKREADAKAVSARLKRAEENVEVLNGERLDVSATFESLAKRVDRLITKAEDTDNDSLALAGMEALRKVLHDIANIQGKLQGQLTVQISLAESKEWLELRDVLEKVFDRYPDAGRMFLDYGRRRKWSALAAPEED